MKRRTFVQLAALASAMPVWARAQTSMVYRLGWLVTSDESAAKPFVESFLAGMHGRGHSIGRNLLVDIRYTRGDATLLSGLTDELIALKPDVLMGIESACRVMAARTRTIPIVITGSVDPVAAGLVKSLSRPGTNVTGVSNQLDLLISKQIELLTEIVPGMSRVGLLSDATYAGREIYERAARSAAKAKGLTLIIAAARDAEGVRQAFADLKNNRVDAVAVAGTGPMFFWRKAVIEGAARSRLPASHPVAQFVEIGGLFSYATDIRASFRNEVADFVDRILKGANPAELPVQQSSRFELVVNLKTARELGIKIPQSVLLRADRVIE